MRKIGTAYFVKKPRVLEDLKAAHSDDNGHPYEIVKTIPLSDMEYENFYTDMVADRQFLEDFSHLCSTGDIWKCLFVHPAEKEDGILVVPDDCYVGWATYISAAVKNQKTQAPPIWD